MPKIMKNGIEYGGGGVQWQELLNIDLPQTSGGHTQTIENIFTFSTIAISVSVNETSGYNFDAYRNGHFPIVMPTSALRKDIQTNLYIAISGISPLILGINEGADPTKFQIYIGNAHSVVGKVKVYGMR